MTLGPPVPPLSSMSRWEAIKELVRAKIQATVQHVLETPNTPGIWAAPFSLAKLATTGEPFLVVADGSHASVSSDGTLCYLPGTSGGSAELVWLSRLGGEAERIGQPREGTTFTLAADPTGTRIARAETENGNQDLWIYDTARGTRTRLTFDPGEDDTPAWSPDGREMSHCVRGEGCPAPDCWKVVRRSIDGKGRVDTLGDGVFPQYTPDGRDILYIDLGETSGRWNMMRVPRDGSGPGAALIPGNPRSPAAFRQTAPIWPTCPTSPRSMRST